MTGAPPLSSVIGQFAGGGRREPAHRQREGARLRQPLHPGQEGPGGDPGALPRVPEAPPEEGQVRAAQCRKYLIVILYLQGKL